MDSLLDRMAGPSHRLCRCRVVEHVLTEHGAGVASLWSAARGEDVHPHPVAWSVGDSPPQLSHRARELIAWSGQEDIIAIDRSDDKPEFFMAFAPVHAGDFAGALALSFTDAQGTISSRRTLRAWLPRHATRIGTLYDVLRTRAMGARANYRLRAAMRVAILLRGNREPLEVEHLLPEQLLVVAGAEWVMLLQWDPESETGQVRASTREFTGTDGKTLIGVGSLRTGASGAPIRRGSLAGDACADGGMVVLPDIRGFSASGTVLVDGVRLPAAGSLILVPIRRGPDKRGPDKRGPDERGPDKNDGPVVGALVCGHGSMGAFTTSDAHTVRDVGVIAAGALASAWVVEEHTEVARTDVLTGLPNRRKFEEKFAESIDWMDRTDHASMALVLADIDFFKSVNDTYGHEAGDEVLKAIALVFAKDRRAIDVVARLGGEELAVILPMVSEAGAREVAERLRALVENMRVWTSVGEISVTASFGVALYRSRAGDAAQIFERADKALYAAKHSGRNRVEMAR